MVELVPVKDWAKPEKEWELDYNGTWAVKCNRIYFCCKADPPEEVQKQIDVGEANVGAKGLKTTW